MSARTRSKRRRSGRSSVHKANGVLQPRVQKVGPERSGLSVSMWARPSRIGCFATSTGRCSSSPARSSTHEAASTWQSCNKTFHRRRQPITTAISAAIVGSVAATSARCSASSAEATRPRHSRSPLQQHPPRSSAALRVRSHPLIWECQREE